jgi:hypothetical protein
LDYDPASAALFAAMTTPPSDARKALINNLIVALKAAGSWATMDTLYVEAAADSQAARLSWKNPGVNTLIEVNSPTFTVDRGYTGNGTTSYLSTGYNPGDGRTYNLTQNSSVIGTWSLTSTAASAGKSGTGALITNGNDLKEYSTSNFIEGRINASTFVTSSPTAVANSMGHTIILRNNSATLNFYKNGASVVNGIPSTSTAVVNQEFAVCARMVSGAANNFSDRQYAITHHGAAMTGGQVTATYNAFLAYLQGVGAA